MKKFVVPLLVLVILVQALILFLRSNVGNHDYPKIFFSGGSYVVEILDDQLEDDSVRAVLYRIVLDVDEFGTWRINDQSSMWACWPDRGHTDFGTGWCE